MLPLCSQEGGLELCNEFRCAAYPVSANKKTFPCHRAKWVTDASAVVLPLTNGNPWHFMHHLLPLTQVQSTTLPYAEVQYSREIAEFSEVHSSA